MRSKSQWRMEDGRRMRTITRNASRTETGRWDLATTASASMSNAAQRLSLVIYNPKYEISSMTVAINDKMT